MLELGEDQRADDAGTHHATTTTAPGTTVVTQSSQLQVLTGTATGTSPCENAAPTPASPGEVGAGGGGSTATESKPSVIVSEHGARGMVKQQNLTEAQRDELQTQIDRGTQRVAAKYPTVADRARRGLLQLDRVRAVHRRALHEQSVSPARSTRRHPSELLYDGTTPDSKIVGLSYLVYHPGGPPPGFAGPNDHWHQHNANGGLVPAAAAASSAAKPTRRRSARRPAGTRPCCSTCGCCTRGSSPASSAAGACSAASARSSVAASAATCASRRCRLGFVEGRGQRLTTLGVGSAQV